MYVHTISLKSANLNAVEANNVLPISAGTLRVPKGHRGPRLSVPRGLSAMNRGRVRKRPVPRLIHQVCSRVPVSMARSRPDGYHQGMSNVLCWSVSVSQLPTRPKFSPRTYFPGSSTLRSFMPRGTSQVPGKKPKPVFASLNSLGHARFIGIKALTWSLGVPRRTLRIVIRQVPVMAPFPHIPGHIEKTVPVWRKGSRW